jgi:hypothetical protein
MSFSPVSVLIAEAYGVSVMTVNMCSICFMATYIPASFTVIWMFNYMSNANVFRIGLFFLLSGTWLRQVATYTDQFYWILIG